MYLIRSLYPEFIRNYYNTTTKRQMTQFLNEQRTWIDISPKKAYKWSISTWTYAPYHLSSGKCKSKPQHYLTPINMTTIKKRKRKTEKENIKISNVGEDVEKLELLHVAGRNVLSWPKNLFGVSYKLLQKNSNKLFGQPNTWCNS